MIRIDREVAALSRTQRLSGLKRIVPVRRIKHVLRECHTNRRICTRVPALAAVLFVLAMGLFCRDCYRQLWRAVWRWNRLGVPGRSTLCEARKRIGVMPLVKLAQQTVRLLGDPQRTPAAFYQGKGKGQPQYTKVAIDGFVIDLPDTPANAGVFGRPAGSRGAGAFPQARLVGLCEVGTHVIWKWLVKPITIAEQTMANYLLRFLTPDMLLMWDRGFLSYQRVGQVIKQGAQLLARVQSRLVFKPVKRLSDGSYLARLYPYTAARRHNTRGILVRIIDYKLNGRAGGEKKHRLLTTLLDPVAHPATDLIELYHDRWEQELAIDEIKTHEMERPQLRSQTPAGVVQELYALMIDHFVVRAVMCEAAQLKQVDPRRISFTAAIKILRCRMADCPEKSSGQKRWWENLLKEISDEVLPERRNRINPRVIKRKMSKWKRKRACHRPSPQPAQRFRDCVAVLR